MPYNKDTMIAILINNASHTTETFKEIVVNLNAAFNTEAITLKNTLYKQNAFYFLKLKKQDVVDVLKTVKSKYNGVHIILFQTAGEIINVG
jgi:LPS O-antigen subunit length determinant protein (WzzB/FepE family)